VTETNLYWQTRRLTQAREDHLTYFLAAALECDKPFRREYERRVLLSLGSGGRAPRIRRVSSQAVFAEQSCRPDLLLELVGGKQVACEHKLEAPQTTRVVADTGEMKQQLERYLELPVDAVAYFRPVPASLSPEIVQHPHYLRPTERDHFLWRDLYEPLSKGDHSLSRWLVDAFGRLGFTPPVPHVGELWGEPDRVRRGPF
jgi:hypothetical protein